MTSRPAISMAPSASMIAELPDFVPDFGLSGRLGKFSSLGRALSFIRPKMLPEQEFPRIIATSTNTQL